MRYAGAQGSSYPPCKSKHVGLTPPWFTLPQAPFVPYWHPLELHIGPLRGGIGGCERLSSAHVFIIYSPRGAGDVVDVRRRLQPLPDVQFDPAVDPLGCQSRTLIRKSRRNS